VGSESTNTSEKDDVLNEDYKVSVDEEKKELDSFDFNSYLDRDDIISMEQIPLVDEADKHCTAYKFLYKSDEYEVAGFISIPNECIEKKVPYPCMIYNRGGNRDYGSITKQDVQGLAYYSYYYDRVVIASQYRGGWGSTGKDEFGGEDLNDVIKLIDLAEKMDFIDIDDLFVIGASRGGMMSYMAARIDDRIKKLIIISGVADLTSTYNERTDMKRLLIELIGGSPQELPQEYEARSAVCWADEINVPVLIFHSKGDDRVSYEQAQAMVNALQEAGKDCTFITYDDDIHGHHKEDFDIILRWLDGEDDI
jgi:dipeptidyl aminopeptidase/acylaminoacyl peptidase